MTILKAIFIDDEPQKDSTRRIIEILADAGIDCELKPPPLLSDLDTLGCDLFITDFELAKVKMSGISFSGNTLSTEYRNRYPNTPIVLLTQERVFSSKSRQIRTDNTALDLIWYKNDAAERPADFVRELISITQGFQALSDAYKLPEMSVDSQHGENRHHSPKWDILLRLMDAQLDESQPLRETNPPVKRGQWIIAEIAEWIRCVIIEYPGVLLDYRYAAVRLGMDPDDFHNNTTLQALFQPAKYTGIFHQIGERWWKNRLIQVAADILLTANVSGPLIDAFVPTYNSQFSQNVRHAICIWDTTEIADHICFIEGKPVKSKNSLLYRPDNRPAFMDQARVSRWAITRNSVFDEFLVDSDSIEIALHWMDEE